MGTPGWGGQGSFGEYPAQGARGPVQGGGFGGGRWTGAASRGLKFLVVCGLAVVMSLMALFVAWLTEDRNTRSKGVRDELSIEAGGPQVFLGPTLLVPYTQPSGDAKQPPIHSVFAFTPSVGHADVKVHAEERRRALYRMPVVESEVALEAEFAPEDLRAAVPKDATLDWSNAAIAVGVSNVRSALSDAVLETHGLRGATGEGAAGAAATANRLVPPASVELAPITTLKTITVDPMQAGVQPGVQAMTVDGPSFGREAVRQSLSVLGTPASAVMGRGGSFAVTAKLRFRGAESVTVLAYAQATTVAMHGDWPNPGFQGAVLPTKRTVSKDGFAAEWFVPAVARGIPAANDTGSLDALAGTAMTTGMVEVADPYQSVERALKYAPLFLGLVFLSYFLFEVTAGKPVHVAQYVLVGVAQLVFYLLLLSFAERIGFDWGFLLGGAATVLLLSVNAGWVFGSARQRWRALGIFSALYAAIYGLLRMEDNALLLGAVGSFLAIAAAMYWTRRLDWYGGNDQKSAAPAVSAGEQG
ncbi:cell envelope integrity protein CreD [Terriglobus sp.]|uniref:cell envelope integrity protein CreD n=1 Tax=Terriglobus sp. TaxID=1889013 RepID=UPI003AFF777E